jgi:hypothetical protein
MTVTGPVVHVASAARRRFFHKVPAQGRGIGVSGVHRQCQFFGPIGMYSASFCGGIRKCQIGEARSWSRTITS